MSSINAVRLLQDEFKRIKGLFAQAETSEMRAPEMRAGVIRELCMLLEIHARMGEQLLYPTFENFPEAATVVKECSDELLEVRQWIQKVREGDPHGEGFDEILNELIEAASAYLETVENRLFPQAETLLGPQLEGLGKEMNELKERLIQSPQYADAQPSVVQNPNGGEQMRRPA